MQLVRTRLEEASQEEQLVESLIPMWDEERQRCHGDLPELPGAPPRSPGPLCKTVEDVRAQFQVRPLLHGCVAFTPPCPCRLPTYSAQAWTLLRSYPLPAFTNLLHVLHPQLLHSLMLMLACIGAVHSLVPLVLFDAALSLQRIADAQAAQASQQDAARPLATPASQQPSQLPDSLSPGLPSSAPHLERMLMTPAANIVACSAPASISVSSARCVPSCRSFPCSLPPGPRTGHTDESLGSQQPGTFPCIVDPLLLRAGLRKSRDPAGQQDPVIESANMNRRERKTKEICGVKQSRRRCLNR